MNSIWKLALKLLALAACAGLALGVTNAITEGPIAARSELDAAAARQQVLSAASSFEARSDSDMTATYAGYDASGAYVGNVCSILTKGYGGEIEIIVGVDPSGVVTGVSVGGANFSETAGLGARTKEAWFGEQFVGQTGNIALRQDGGSIDAVTSATISSRAVTNAIATAAASLSALPQLTKGAN